MKMSGWYERVTYMSCHVFWKRVWPTGYTLNHFLLHWSLCKIIKSDFSTDSEIKNNKIFDKFGITVIVVGFRPSPNDPLST